MRKKNSDIMLFYLGRKRSLLLLTCLVMFLLVMTVTHFLSPPVLSKDDFVGAREPVEDQASGGSWRLVSHEVEDEDEAKAKPIAKVSFKNPQTRLQPDAPAAKTLKSKCFKWATVGALAKRLWARI